MYETKKENKADGKIPKEGNGMALTKNDLHAIQELLQPINKRLDGIDDRLDGIDDRLDGMDNRQNGMDSHLDRIENRLDRIENKLVRIDSEVSALKNGQLEMRKELKDVNCKISETYDLALDAWGKSTENRGWLEREGSFSAKGFR